MRHPLYDAPTYDKPIQVQPKIIELPPEELTIFDEVAVDENYDGKLAAHQIQQFRRQMLHNVLWTIASYSVTLFLALTTWNSREPVHSLLAITLLLALCTFVCFPWLRRTYKLQIDLRTGEVSRTDGTIVRSHKLKQLIGRRYTRFYYDFYLSINGTKYQVSKEVYLMCGRRVPYRVYYMPHTLDVVNVHSL